MNRKDSPQSVIDSYRRRQQMAPVYIAVLAVLLVVAGIVILWLWSRLNSNQPVVSFAAATATATETQVPPTSTNTTVPPTATATVAPTITSTATITVTATAAGPFEYKVESGDNCWTIATDKFKINPDVLAALNGFKPGECPIKPGMTILIPLPDTKLPTDTPVPTGASEKITYYVRTGETLAEIAAEFHASKEQIMKDNNITDENTIKAGDKLTIMTNTTTATPTATATFTKAAPSATATQSAAATATPTKKP